MPRQLISLLVVLLCALGSACIEGQTRSDSGSSAADNGSSATDSKSSTADSGVSAEAGSGGPGPYGALPNGYCCTADDQCRCRRCMDHGGGRMCADTCKRAEDCLGPPNAFHCPDIASLDGGHQPQRRCVPVAPQSTPCIAAHTLVPGDRPTGTCCNDRKQCLGGHCSSIAWGAAFCTHPCEEDGDCPVDFRCIQSDRWSGGTFSICVPWATDFACTP